jgi:hypothetical protein
VNVGGGLVRRGTIIVHNLDSSFFFNGMNLREQQVTTHKDVHFGSGYAKNKKAFGMEASLCCDVSEKDVAANKFTGPYFLVAVFCSLAVSLVAERPRDYKGQKGLRS